MLEQLEFYPMSERLLMYFSWPYVEDFEKNLIDQVDLVLRYLSWEYDELVNYLERLERGNHPYLESYVLRSSDLA